MGERKLRRLPRQCYAPAGPVPVRRKRNLTHPDTDQKLFGLWDPAARVIYVESKLSLETAWQVLYHEQFHAWVDDIGVLVPNEKLERLCDGYAMCRMGEIWSERPRG